jgi:hypothetical protein
MIFFSARDLLLCREYKKLDDGILIITKSTLHQDYPITSEYVRSEYILQAIKLKENKDDKDSTDVLVIHQMRMSNWFPSWMCNRAMKHFSNRIMSQMILACDYTIEKEKIKE